MTTNEPPPYPGDPNPPANDLPAYGSTPPTGPPPPEGQYPPPPPGGYQPPVGGGSPYSPTEAIGWGWRKFRQNTGAMILAVLIVALATGLLGVMSEILAPTASFMTSDGGFQFDASASAASLVAQTITGTIAYIFSAMLARGALDVADGGTFDIGQAFGRLDVVKVLLTGLLLSVLTTIGFALCVLPGIVFAIFSFFTIYFVVDTGASPVDALKSSFSLVAGNFGNAFLTGLLTVLVVMAGVIACLVGLLAAVPTVTLAGAYAYRRFQNQPVSPAA